MPLHVHHPSEGRAGRLFGRFATNTSNLAGKGGAFALAAALVLVWLLTGPVFGFSDTWQLVINTSTTIVTFLMVFLIQHAQNKDTRVLHLKLNELIASVEGASNRLIDLEDLTEDEIEALHERFQRLARDAKRLQVGAQTTVENEQGG